MSSDPMNPMREHDGDEAHVAREQRNLGEPHHHRRRIDRGRPRITVNLTPMIDVVFLLLVYFMVATEFKADEEIYRMDLPDRQASRQQRDPFDLDEEPLRVSIGTSGPGLSGYRLQVEGPYEQPASFEELHEFLRQRLISPESRTGLFEPDHPIIIAPTTTTRWEHVIEAFNAAARARYTNVTFAPPS